MITSFNSKVKNFAHIIIHPSNEVVCGMPMEQVVFSLVADGPEKADEMSFDQYVELLPKLKSLGSWGVCSDCEVKLIDRRRRTHNRS